MVVMVENGLPGATELAGVLFRVRDRSRAIVYCVVSNSVEGPIGGAGDRHGGRGVVYPKKQSGGVCRAPPGGFPGRGVRPPWYPPRNLQNTTFIALWFVTTPPPDT